MRGLLLVWLVVVLVLPGCQSQVEDDRLGFIDDFQFTERSGKPVGLADLKGKVWVAAFFFTRCAGPCKQISGNLAGLQQAVARQRDVVLVSFSVDPDHDTPKVLQEYAENFRADPDRWLFLTGDRDRMYALIEKSFRLGVAQNEGTARTPGNEVMHSNRLVLVDRQGQKRGYFDGVDPQEIARLRQKMGQLVQEKD